MAGYSFGAWVALKAVAQGLKPDILIRVSPPIDFLKFDDLSLPAIPSLITLGERDDFCGIKSLKDWLEHGGGQTDKVQLELIPAMDHFYWAKEQLLQSITREFLARFGPC